MSTLRPVRSKRIFDFLGALALGLILSPFILVIALLIRLEGQPVVFRHKRVGRHGKVFHCLKFRTMAPNAEQLLRDLLKAHPELRDEWTQIINCAMTRASLPWADSCVAPAWMNCRSSGT